MCYEENEKKKKEKKKKEREKYEKNIKKEVFSCNSS